MKDWKKIVAGIAPTVATALGGPLAGTAVRFLGKELLGDENAPQAEIEAAIVSATPADLLKLKEIDKNFDLEMARIGVDLHKIGADDRQSARNMAIHTSLWPQMILSALFILGYFTLLFVLFSGKIMVDTSVRDPANVLLGVLSAGIPMILKFWFGGSPNDDKHIERIYNSVPK